MGKEGYPGTDLKLRQNLKFKIFKFCILEFFVLGSALSQEAPFPTTENTYFWYLKFDAFWWRHFRVVFIGDIAQNIPQWNHHFVLLDVCFKNLIIKKLCKTWAPMGILREIFQWKRNFKSLLPCRRKVNLFWCLHLLISSNFLFDRLYPLYEATSSFSLRHR